MRHRNAQQQSEEIMANNSTQASFMVQCGTAENAQKVASWIQGCEGTDYPGDLRTALENEGMEFESGIPDYTIADATVEQEDETAVWVNFQDGDLAATAVIIQYAMDTMPEVPSPQGWTWAN